MSLFILLDVYVIIAISMSVFNISAERELLITQGLNDLDIQEDQNAVFICELSVEDIPGEWYKNGERIQPTSTVKIRQEGQLWRGVGRKGARQSWPLPSRAEDEHWRSVLINPHQHLPLSSLFPPGTKHFLLMCNVRPEDTGEIKFIARRVESVAYLDVEGIRNVVV